MTLLRDLWADLRERRLWPVAALLVIALVAIPVVLGRSSGAAETPAPIPAPLPASTASSDGEQAVSLAAGPVARMAARGRPRDPFRGAPKAKQPAESVAPPATPVAATPSDSIPADTPAATPAAPPSAPDPAPVPADTSTPPTTPTAPPVTGVAAGYRTDLRFGPAGRDKPIEDLLRLRALEGAAGPLLVYLGVREDRKTAVFLLTSTAEHAGDGRCQPSATACQMIELSRGESEFFDVPTGEAGVEQYELYVERVSSRRAATVAKARTVLREESRRGRNLMYDTIAAGATWMRNVMYSSLRGVVYTRYKKAAAGQ
jgi:hypothetical protein